MDHGGGARGRHLVDHATLDLTSERADDGVCKCQRRFIFRRANQRQAHDRPPARECEPTEVGHHLVLDASAQHATAQQQRVDLDRIRRLGGDGDADQAVVSKAITDAYREHRRAVAEGAHLEFAAPPRAEVELIGAMGQL